MTRDHQRQIRAWLVLLIAIGAVLGHVVPLHAHLDEVASATPGHRGHDERDDHAVYSASCEALRTAPVQLAASAVMVSTIVPELPGFVPIVVRLAAPVFRTESPPLFLLHAALLI